MLFNHDTFVEATKSKRKIILTYFSGEQNLYLTKLCVPVEYTPPDENETRGYYYFWDPKGEVGERILGLQSSQIVYMELSDETFNPTEYIVSDAE